MFIMKNIMMMIMMILLSMVMQLPKIILFL